MLTLIKLINGNKTYLVAVITILTSFIGYAEGTITMPELVAAIFAALGLGAVRHGISKVEKKL